MEWFKFHKRSREKNKNGISMITPTIKEQCIKNIIDNYHRQYFQPRELIIIINHQDINEEDFKKYIYEGDDIRIFKFPELTQGECLNYGISQSKYDYIAKIDDDDYYGPLYLVEMYNALEEGALDIVGKNEPYYYFVDEGILIEQKRYHENMYVNRVAGATLCFKKKVWEQVKFINRNSAIDTDFMRKCKLLGYNIFSVSKKNYVILRYNHLGNHTWKVTKEELLRCKAYEVVLKNTNMEQVIETVNMNLAIKNTDNE